MALIRLREYLTVTIHRVSLTHQEIIHPGYQQQREEVLQAIETQIKQLHMLRSYEIQVAHHLEVEQIILTHPAIPMGQALHCEMHILGERRSSRIISFTGYFSNPTTTRFSGSTSTAGDSPSSLSNRVQARMESQFMSDVRTIFKYLSSS